MKVKMKTEYGSLSIGDTVEATLENVYVEDSTGTKWFLNSTEFEPIEPKESKAPGGVGLDDLIKLKMQGNFSANDLIDLRKGGLV